MTTADHSAIPLVYRAGMHAERVALQTAEGVYSYDALLDASARIAGALLAYQHVDDLGEARVPFLVTPGFGYVATLWGIWRAGGVAVPLCPVHPEPELRHVIVDADAAALVGDEGCARQLATIAKDRELPLLSVEVAQQHLAGPFPRIAASRRAMIFYTSGTTGRPKGAVLSHAALTAQIESLTKAWEWVSEDRILCVLPLHHVHGVVNVLCCALWSGACCEIHPRFDAAAVWQRFCGKPPLTLFMAVPTIYAALARAWQDAPPAAREAFSAACRSLRLFVSGSAPLPVALFEQWRALSGHRLLERYGMTEIGMALSNPLRGSRLAGTVGRSLPGVLVRIVDEQGQAVAPGSHGELQVRGPGLLLEYWRRPAETRRAFVDGWFRTGDIAVQEEGGVHRLLGRSSADIIKTGGYKVSALEVEEVLRECRGILECAVIGLPDAHWGERAVAAVVLASDAALTLDGLREFCRSRLAPYKIPQQLVPVEALPKNPLGKVLKLELQRQLQEPAQR